VRSAISISLGTALTLNFLLFSATETTARTGRSTPPQSVQTDKEQRVLSPNAAIERDLTGETHSYLITLASGQFLRVIADPRGVFMIMKLFAPDGSKLADVTNSNSRQAAEGLSLVADASGNYRLEISFPNPPTDGVARRYSVKIDDLRPATARDNDRIRAERAFTEGRGLQARGEAAAFKEARRRYDEALRVFRELSDRSREAATLQYLGNVSHNLGDPRAAISYYKEALSLWRVLNDKLGQAQTLNSMGWSLYGLGELQQALSHYDLAIPLWRELGEPRGEAQAISTSGAVRETLGDRQIALDNYFHALSLARKAKDRALEAYTLNNMSWLYFRLDETQKALDHANQALPIWREVKNMAGEATAYHNIASVYDVLKQFEKALEYYNRSLKLWHAYGNGYGEAQALNNIGNIYYFQHEYQKALDHYARSLEFWQRLGNKLEQAETLSNIGLIYQSLGDSKRAVENHQRGLVLAREVGNRSNEAAVLHNLGFSYFKQGGYLKALESFSQELALRQAVGHRSGEVGALIGIANVERRRGNLTEALSSVERALDLIESLRTRIANQELRASYFASNNEAYDFQINLLMQLHEREPAKRYEEAALIVSERSRARSLLDTLAEVRADIRQGAEIALLDRERQLQQLLNAKAERLTRLLGGKHNEEQSSAVRREVDDLLAEFQLVQARIRTESPRYAALTQPRPISVQEIQQQVLDQDSLLLEYSLGKERSFLWAVTPTSIKTFVLPAEAEIVNAARRVYSLLNARNQHPANESPERRAVRVEEADAEYSRAAAELSQILLGPVVHLLGTKRLIVVSEDALQYVPFSALPVPRLPVSSSPIPPSPRPLPVPLIVRHEIVTLPSASVLASLRRELRGRKPAPEAVAVVADPVFRRDDPRVRAIDRVASEKGVAVSLSSRMSSSEPDVESSAKEFGTTEFKRLRFSRQEADAITALAPGNQNLRAIDFAANRAIATSAELSRYRILHFATHGLINSRHPELSGIVLSLVDEQGNPQDGFLRLHEIYNLKLGADLVVLSACRTALGMEISGEGLIGLTRGFMYAGSPRVVASLWNVDDRATAELMKRFYQAMFSKNMSPAAALRAAQTSFVAEKGWAAPYYWAGFTLQGEWK
jgi:CHAT domain-containing protein/Tfp pilus assembly protein PilF